MSPRYQRNPQAPGSKYAPVAKLASAEELLSTGRARANQKVTKDQSFMSNLLKKDRELVVLGDGVGRCYSVL